MSLEVRVRSRARTDIYEAANWYESQRKGLGGDFLDEIASTFARIFESPTLYPEIHRGIRRVVLRRFPFGVFYQLRTDVVVVIAVMHASRDPRRWRERT